MLSLEQLKAQIGAYASGKISLGDFEDWFYEHSVDPVDSDVDGFASDVNAALSGVHFGHHNQGKLRKDLRELANAARPFVEIVVTLSEKARSLSPVPLPAQAVYRFYADSGLPVNARIVLASSMVERIAPSGDVVRVPRTASAIELVSPVYAES